jgi:predicted outer membrane repeat protein
MKKLRYTFFAAACAFLASGALAFLLSCENPIVDEMLQDMATLSNIAIMTEDGAGDRTELNYGLSPAFAARSLSYRAFIPRTAEKLLVVGAPYDGSKAKYRIQYRGPDPNDPRYTTSPETIPVGDYIPYDIENAAGEFDLPLLVKFFTLSLAVSREHRWAAVYTVQVVRKQPAWVQDIQLRTQAEGEAAVLDFKWQLEPGFNSSILQYNVGVNYNAVAFELGFTRRATDNTAIAIDFSPGYDSLLAQNPPEIAETGDGARYAFPRTEKRKTVTVTVHNPEEDPEPLVYYLTIIRPEQVIIKDPIKEQNNYIILSAGEGAYFPKGDFVNFKVIPPFGHTVGTVTARTIPGGLILPWVSSSSSEGTGENSYTFEMGAEQVELDATWVEVPRSTDLNVRYVYEKGAYPGKIEDGRSWATARKDLQKLIDEYTGVSPNDYEIWVAKGNVRPIWDWVPSDPSVPLPSERPGWAGAIQEDQRYQDNWGFVLKNGVKIYGGFNGTERTVQHRNTRDIVKNETILWGEMEQDGSARHLLFAIGITEPTLVDGLSIAKAIAGGRASNLTIAGVPLSGGVWYGAGVYVMNSTRALKFSRVTIRDNSTMHGSGGYIYNASPAFVDCVIKDNMSFTDGGGITVAGNSSPLFENCLFQNNRAGAGAGIYGNGASTAPVLINTRFVRNQGRSFQGTGSLYMEGGEVLDGADTGIYLNGTASTNLVLTNVRISGNRSTAAGGGIFFQGRAPGSGILPSIMALTNVLVSGNRAATNGGGIYVASNSVVQLVNTTVAHNYANNGGGIYFNVALTAANTDTEIANTIIWGNKASAAANDNIGSANRPTEATYIFHSLIGGYTTVSTNHNITNTTDPLFVDPQPVTPSASASSIAGDFRLQATSPLIDMGDDGPYGNIHEANVCAEDISIDPLTGQAAIPASGVLHTDDGPFEDLAGQNRHNGAIDLGAYELQ